VLRASAGHKAANSEELSFKIGEIIVKMGEPNADGMAKGMKQDGTMGLYPVGKLQQF
jgi:hypothetical protein